MRPTATTLILVLAALVAPATAVAQSQPVGQRSFLGGRIVLGTPQARAANGRLLPGQRSFLGGRIVLGTARDPEAGSPPANVGSRLEGRSREAGFFRNSATATRRVGALQRVNRPTVVRVPRLSTPSTTPAPLAPTAPQFVTAPNTPAGMSPEHHGHHAAQGGGTSGAPSHGHVLHHGASAPAGAPGHHGHHVLHTGP